MRKLLAAVLLAGAAVGSAQAQDAAYTFKHPSWMWEEGAVGVWHKKRLAEFQAKYPNIKIDATLVPTGSYENVVTTQIAAGDVPDLMPVFTNMLAALIDAKVLAPLDDCIATASYKDRILPSIKFSQKDGKTYGIPLTMSPQSMLYNKKLLDQAGVGIPTTVDEFYKAAKAVKDKTGQWGYAFNNKLAEILQTYIVSMQWTLGLGSDWSQADGKITAADPKTIEAISWIKRFLDEGISPKGLDAVTVRTMFAEGKVAFLFDGPWVMTQVKTSNAALYPDVGYATMPTPTHTAITGGAFYTIPAGSKHKADACKYLEIINAEGAQREWLENLVQIPGTSVQAGEEFLKVNPWVKNMIEVAAKYPGGLGYAPPGYAVRSAEFRQIVVDGLAQVFAGSKKVEDGLGDTQKALEAWAKK